MNILIKGTNPLFKLSSDCLGCESIYNEYIDLHRFLEDQRGFLREFEFSGAEAIKEEFLEEGGFQTTCYGFQGLDAMLEC